MLDRGRLVAVGTPAELRRQVPGGSIASVRQPGRARLAAPCRRLARRRRLALTVASDGGWTHSVACSIGWMLTRSVEALSVQSADLDDVFLSLTGGPR
jgi:ABC-2 type transport system ATP-binding protein